MIYYWDCETTGTNAFSPTNRVTMVGIMSETDECQFFYDNSEKDLLERFWAYVKEHEGTYCGFNCLTFDWVYLIKRSIVCGVKPFMPFRRWIFDLRNALDSDKFATGTLGTICELISGEHKFEGLGGEEVIKLFYDGNYEKLKDYLKQDLILTKILYTRMKECGVI
jgi:DNA polymerase elongation subunit (family B)